MPGATVKSIICRLAYLVFAVLPALTGSCARPPADLLSYLPPDTLAYAETADLESVTGVFTGNPDWKSVSKVSDPRLSYLKNKRAAIAVTGFQHSETGNVLEVKPKVLLAIDTGLSQAGAAAFAGELLKNLSLRLFESAGEPVAADRDGVPWILVTGPDDKKMYSAVSGSVILAGNDEATVAAGIERHRARDASLSQDETLKSERSRQAAAGTIAFGYISPGGVREIAGYLGVAYAIDTSDDAPARGMISDLLPRMLGETIMSVTWTARRAAADNDAGVEDAFFIRTEKSFAQNLFQTVKASDAGKADNAFVPAEAGSATHYSLAEPRTAWRGAALSLAAKLTGKDLAVFSLLAQGLLKSYGVDQPEMFLGAADGEITTVRLDRDDEPAAAIVKVGNAAEIRKSMSETFDFGGKAEQAEQAEQAENAQVWQSRDGRLAAAFAGQYLIAGDPAAVHACLRAGSSPAAAPLVRAGFPANGAIVGTRQKDRAAQEILSRVSPGESFTHTKIEQAGVRRTTVSEFGLFGEIYRQTMRRN